MLDKSKLRSFYSLSEDERAPFYKVCLNMEFAPPPEVTPEMLKAAAAVIEKIWIICNYDDDGEPGLDDYNLGDICGYVWAAMEEVRKSAL